jgi:hypothetical protein
MLLAKLIEVLNLFADKIMVTTALLLEATFLDVFPSLGIYSSLRVAHPQR